MATIIGIDLGTTNSLCSVFEAGVPKLVRNTHGDFLTPSVVGVLEGGEVLVGAPAKELRVTRPEQCVSRFKRHMGTNWTTRIGTSEFSAIELSSLVLKSLKQDAEAHLGEPVEEAVVTVPAYFNDHQRKATKLAGEMAGLKVRRILNEPTAAALTYGFHDRQASKHVLVIDLGGGTFDVTLMEIFEGTLEIVATSGESFLGGEDFTDRLAAAVLKKEGISLEVAELKQPLRVARLRQECEQAKRELATAETCQIRLPNEAGELSAEKLTITLNRQGFAALVDPLLKRLAGPVHKALRDAQCEPAAIDEVLFVGGATRMACMYDFINELCGVPPQMKYNPDEVVALGAAIQAALIIDDRAVDDMVMTDVCPHTLGVEIAKEFGARNVPGYFLPLIHRNTTIPVSREEIVSTMEHNQYKVEVRVFQGVSRKVKDNLLLGSLEVDGIPPGPPGMPIAIRFTYDMSGILEVEAFVVETGKKFRTVLTQHAAGLSPKEIDAAMRRMQKIKFYPRDDAENQRLLLFCERIVGEVSPFQREQLESAIDTFEQSMSSGDRDFFQAARDGLRMTLSQLGFPCGNPEDNA